MYDVVMQLSFTEMARKMLKLYKKLLNVIAFLALKVLGKCAQVRCE